MHISIKIASVIGAYILGAIPFGVMIGRFHGVNIRDVGSCNTGSTNVGRVLGRKWGLLCFVLDVLKGFVSVFAFGAMLRSASLDTDSSVKLAMSGQFWWLAVAFAAIFGHVYSVFLKFSGGKGVATSLGVLLGIWPYFTMPGVGVFVLWVAITYFSGYVSLASISAAAAFPLIFAIYAVLAGESLIDLWPLLSFAVVMAALVILKHKANISRLIAGNENRVKWSIRGK